MRRVVLLALFTATIPVLVYRQTDPGAQAKPTPSASQPSGAVDEALMKLDRELMDAAVRNDKTVFNERQLSAMFSLTQEVPFRRGQTLQRAPLWSRFELRT